VKDKMRLAVIPARGGSKRIPKKNIVPFCGEPLISYALDAVKGAGIFDRVHVSTDSHEIAEVVEKLGFPVDFMRDGSLADDHTGIVPVLRWVVKEYEQRGLQYDEICCIYPTAPLLKSSDLVEAFRIFEQNRGGHPLLVYARYPVPVEWAFRRDENGFMSADDPKKILIRSQDLQHAYYECGPFTLWRTEHLKKDNPLKGKVLSYIMPTERAVDIDTPDDLAYAEHLFSLMAKA